MRIKLFLKLNAFIIAILSYKINLHQILSKYMYKYLFLVFKSILFQRKTVLAVVSYHWT